jgi:hypothetical protein
LAVELTCGIDALQPEVGRWCEPFEVPEWPSGFAPISGSIRPYDAAEVARLLPASAVPVSRSGDLLELYHEGERFWLIDERWGLTEINIFKMQWRSWILPHPTVDPVRCAEMAIHWPMAQLLRGKGLHLIPAASLTRDDQAYLIISPFNIESELRAFLADGYRIIGQRWTALREETVGKSATGQERIEMLHLPGQVEHDHRPQLRIGAVTPRPQWTDLATLPDAHTPHAFCTGILLIEPGRRLNVECRELPVQMAATAVRSAWPIMELHPQRRHSLFPARLARQCRCWNIQLSRRPEDLLDTLDEIRCGLIPAMQEALPPLTPQVTVSISPHLRRRRQMAG